MRMASIWLLLFLLGSSCAQLQTRPLAYQIQEELPPNTLIGNIPLDAHMESRYNMTILGKLRFSFLTMPSGISDKMFTVEDRSGILQTVGRVDRDVLCPSQPVCELMFDIAVRPAKYFQIIKALINITDINDNNPRFPQPHIVHQISESALPGKSFSIPAAEDPDSGKYGVQDYALVSNQDKFDLKVRETADGAIDLRLVLMKELDREERDFYQVRIVASDGGKPSKSGTVVIDVHILDANDNDPKFENGSYEVSVLENVPVGTAILRVRAIDPDQGLNGKVEYAFSRHTEQNYGDLFGIDSDTGEIFLKAELDYEKAYIYLLSVTAQDKGPDSLPAQANVVVRVQDVDDNAPQITVNTLTTTGDAHVTENTPPGTFVAHISVIDTDSGDNGKVTCNLDNDKFLLQKLYMTEYKIVTASTFDRERQPYFDLRLRCMDHGEHPLSSFAHIRVTVMDENDHSPEFSQQFYSATFTENNHVNEFILAVTATDRDEGKNGWVHYAVADDARNMVTIDQETGWITANVVFDHEQVQELRFHVIATDKAAEPRSSTATVLITVLDVDDEKPEFQHHSQRLSLFENQPAGTEVGQVVAKDRDSDPYNYFTYRLDHSRSPTDIFEIDPYNGKIRTKQVLDREDRPVYYLVVIAQGDASSKSSTTSLTVYVADKNDNAPEFYFPNARNNTIHVSNQVPTGHVITRLQANDRDSAENAKLSFYFHSGNEEDYFTLDKTLGLLKVNRDLTKFKEKTFPLQIRVEDEGEPQLASLAELKLVVNNALGYQRASTGMHISRDNLIILIVFGAATFIISTIIIATIIVIRRKDRQQDEGEEDKKAGEMEKMLNVEDQSNSTAKSPSTFNQTANKRYISSNDIGKLKQNSDISPSLNSNSERTDTLGRNTLKSVPPSRQPLLNEGEFDPEELPPPPDNWIDPRAPRRVLPVGVPMPQLRHVHNFPDVTHTHPPLASSPSPSPAHNSRVTVAQPHLLAGHEDSDSGSSAVSNSDSGRGPSSEEDDLQKVGQGVRNYNQRVGLPAANKERSDPLCIRPEPRVLGRPAVVGGMSRPDVVCKSPSASAFGELHPHNLIRASPEQELLLHKLRASQDQLHKLRASQEQLHCGYSTLPMPRRTSSGRISPLQGYSDYERNAYALHPLARGHSKSLVGGSTLLPEQEPAYYCDPVRDDRTTNV